MDSDTVACCYLRFSVTTTRKENKLSPSINSEPLLPTMPFSILFAFEVSLITIITKVFHSFMFNSTRSTMDVFQNLFS